MTIHFNWKEIAAIAENLSKDATGATVDRIIVPIRKNRPDGFIKNEWCLRLRRKGTPPDIHLIMSVRQNFSYLYYADGKGPPAAEKATHSGFDLALNKNLRGRTLQKIRAIPNERILFLDFGEYGISIHLIPTRSEAALVRISSNEIIASTRGAHQKIYYPPSPGHPPRDAKVRQEILSGSKSLQIWIETQLDSESFEERKRALTARLRHEEKLTQEGLNQAQEALTRAQNEPNWLSLGHLLTTHLHDPPPLESIMDGIKKISIRKLTDPETGQPAALPCDPALDAKTQAERYYFFSKRKTRRIEESQARIETFRIRLLKIQNWISRSNNLTSTASTDWELIERETGFRNESEKRTARIKRKQWQGPSFISEDGWPILVGRNQKENQELTFHVAHGNDLWLHVRGRPGAHGVIPVPAGKTVPLEALLDAAALVVFYSGGKNWGKTEVDYTAKKHVRKIKNSTEVTYTQNKTLLVNQAPERLKRLLSKNRI